MGIKLIKKTNEAENKKFDFSIVDAYAKNFDFINLNSRLQQFRGWLEDLQLRVDVPAPTVRLAVGGGNGLCYEIRNGITPAVTMDLRCGTNPEIYPAFKGEIRAGGKVFKINGIDDLTDKLIDDIAAAAKGEA